jgi:hypothetical protein
MAKLTKGMGMGMGSGRHLISTVPTLALSVYGFMLLPPIKKKKISSLSFLILSKHRFVALASSEIKA